MASKSRGSKTGTKAGSTRKSKTAPLAEDVMTSSAALALVVDTGAAVEGDPVSPVAAMAAESAMSTPVAESADVAAPPTAVRRRSRKSVVASSSVAEAPAPAAAPRKRSRKATPKASDLPPAPESPAAHSAAPDVATPQAALPEAAAPGSTAELDVMPVSRLEVASPEADAVGGDPEGAVDDARFADALAGAFLYAPELDPDDEPGYDHRGSAFVQGGEPERLADPAADAPTPPAPAAVRVPVTPEPVEAPKADLPFIIDVPREVPVVDDAPVDEWVERILNADPRELTAMPREPRVASDEWVDQVLEPSKTPIPARPRPRVQPVRTPTARPAARPAPKSVAKPALNAAASAAAPLSTARSAPAAAAAPRWWLLLPMLLVVAVALVFSRSGGTHAPVPDGVLGAWTTGYWLYEHQTLEIKPDTVVATLDETVEGRFPITKVETVDAEREVSVKITYRNNRGEEKDLDFLADKDPTTALRFRSHAGLVWVREE